jgi:SAM-dependent methyltransferase
VFETGRAETSRKRAFDFLHSARPEASCRAIADERKWQPRFRFDGRLGGLHPDRGRTVTTAYDLVRYPSWPIPETHPASLAVFAALYGLPFVPPQKCRVLEIGCGEGVNLMSMAVTASQAEFVGIDLAERPIATGRETARVAGLGNVTLQAQDLLATGPDLGQFDYIVAHGLYAWVPEPVRAAVMRLIGRSLCPDGLAFVSYNAYPGCRLREVLRDLLLDATRGVEEPAERLATAHAALRRQIGLWSEADPFKHALMIEAQNMLKRPPELLFHDELGGAYAPQLLGTIVEAARAEDLDYLCDTTPELNAEALFPSETFESVVPFTGGDWMRFEQLTDFTDMRRFRRSIFCRSGRAIDRRAVPERLEGLWASAEIELLRQEPGGPDGFVLRAVNGAELSVRDSSLADILVKLGLAFPMSLPLEGIAGFPELARALLHLFVSGIVTLSAGPSGFVLTPGERPVASALARAQAARGETHLASLRHKPVHLMDAGTRAFVALMDGSRTRGELAAAMADQPGMTADKVAARMPEALAEMARLGLMMG